MRFFKVAAAFALMLSTPSLALAEQAAPAGAPPILGTVLSFNADGLSTGQPDIATISLGVTTQGPNAAAAVTQNAQRMNALLDRLKRAGIAERDLQTSNISVNPQYEQRENQSPRITGYEANN